MTLYCATTNAGKLREFRLAVERFGRGAFELATLPGLTEIPPCPEDGTTFEENAVRKAMYYGARVRGVLFAEDSGLEVDALGGAPGVYSARFAGPNAREDDNNRLLLEKLKGAGDRTARFVCVAALVRDGELMGTYRGAVEGRIAEEASGQNGFGYDPLFFYPPFGSTLAASSPEQKLSVSHRGRALAAMLASLTASTAGIR